MWERKALKEHAKLFLKQYYWTALAVCIVAILLGASSQTVSVFQKVTPAPTRLPNYYYYATQVGGTVFQALVWPLRLILSSVYNLVSLGFFLIFLVFRVIVTNNVRVGRARYFNQAVAGDNQFNYLFSSFRQGQWAPIAIKMFKLDLIIFLWSLFFIFPGIIKMYQYKFVPFILADEPQLSLREAMDRSTQMTDQDKLNLFVLDLSFFPWYLLGALLFGIGNWFVEPYPKATEATLYRIKRDNPWIRGA